MAPVISIWTVGHSTHAIDAFVSMLQAHAIRAIADVRRFPASRRYPHFNADALRQSLAAHDIQYHPMPELGGRRNPKPDSRNTAWRNRSFQGYADYMETPEFSQAMEKLLAIAAQRSTAIMCAELLWWRCHRALIADYLTARGVAVMHIRDAMHVEPHRYTSPAQIVNGKLSYAGAQLELGS